MWDKELGLDKALVEDKESVEDILLARDRLWVQDTPGKGDKVQALLEAQ